MREAAQNNASKPEVGPLHTIRLGPFSANLIATEEAITLLDALGKAMGLRLSTDSSLIVAAERQTVSRLPRLELATTAVVEPSGQFSRPSSISPASLSPSLAAVSANWVARSL